MVKLTPVYLTRTAVLVNYSQSLLFLFIQGRGGGVRAQDKTEVKFEHFRYSNVLQNKCSTTKCTSTGDAQLRNTDKCGVRLLVVIASLIKEGVCVF